MVVEGGGEGHSWNLEKSFYCQNDGEKKGKGRRLARRRAEQKKETKSYGESLPSNIPSNISYDVILSDERRKEKKGKEGHEPSGGGLQILSNHFFFRLCDRQLHSNSRREKKKRTVVFPYP